MAAKIANESLRWMYHDSSMQAVIFGMATLSLISGVAQCLVLKWQNRTKVFQCTTVAASPYADGIAPFTNCRSQHFTQAFLQTFFMFAGECIAIPYYYFVERPRRSKNRQSDSTTTTPTTPTTTGSLWWWVTPAPLDFLECALGCVAVTITYASTVQMLHNFMVISSAVFTMLIIQTPLRIHEWLGCLIVTAALILTSVPALLNPEPATEFHESLHWLGILLALISTCIHSLQNIWEEALFQKSNISASQAVGLEGLTGLLISGGALPIVQMTGYELPSQGFVQLGQSAKLSWGMGLFAVASLMNNVCGIAVTKWSSGLLRCLFMSIRAPLVWIIEMYFGWNSFDWANFASMFVLTAGLALYIMVYPFTAVSEKVRNVLLVPITCGCLKEEDEKTLIIQLTELELSKLDNKDKSGGEQQQQQQLGTTPQTDAPPPPPPPLPPLDVV